MNTYVKNTIFVLGFILLSLSAIFMMTLNFVGVSLFSILGLSNAPITVITAVEKEAERQMESVKTTGEWSEPFLSEIAGADDVCVLNDDNSYTVLAKYAGGEYTLRVEHFKNKGWTTVNYSVEDVTSSYTSLFYKACIGEPLIGDELPSPSANFALDDLTNLVEGVAALGGYIGNSDTSPKM